VEIAYLRGSRGAKGCLHYLFRRDAPPKPLSVRGVQFPLISSLRIDPAGIIAEPVSQVTASGDGYYAFLSLSANLFSPIPLIPKFTTLGKYVLH
jgi:hypothetical protein